MMGTIRLTLTQYDTLRMLLARDTLRAKMGIERHVPHAFSTAAQHASEHACMQDGLNLLLDAQRALDAVAWSSECRP